MGVIGDSIPKCGKCTAYRGKDLDLKDCFYRCCQPNSECNFNMCSHCFEEAETIKLSEHTARKENEMRERAEAEKKRKKEVVGQIINQVI